MKKIYEMPQWMIESVYDSISRGCVIRTISISDVPGIAGGSPDITPLHLVYKGYVSLQDFVNSLQEGFVCNDEDK